VGSLSGCSAIQDLLPGGGDLGAYGDWVYAPDTFESDQETLGLSATSYEGILSNSENLNEDTRESITTRNYPDLGINGGDVSMELSLPEGRVITGSFDTEAVKAELTADQLSTPTDSFGSSGPVGSTEYESDSTYNDDYEIFVQSEPEESPNAYGVGNGTIIEGRRVPNSSSDASPVDASEVVEGTIDTGTEGNDRFVDSNDDFSTLVDTLDSGATVSGFVRENEVGSDDGPSESIINARFDGLIAAGSSASINGDTTDIRIAFVYDSEGDVNEGDVQDWVEANDTGSGGALTDLNDISVSTDANTATVEGSIETYAWSPNNY